MNRIAVIPSEPQCIYEYAYSMNKWDKQGRLAHCELVSKLLSTSKSPLVFVCVVGLRLIISIIVCSSDNLKK